MSWSIESTLRQALAPIVLLIACALSASGQSVPTPRLTADAGPDRFLTPPATSVVLRGTIHGLKVSRIPNDSNTIILWSKLSGPALTILDHDTLTPTVFPSQPGLYRLRLKVFDRRAGFDTDDVQLRVFDSDSGAVLSGEPRLWHTLSLTFTHDQVLSEASSINPFLDLRLVVDFVHESGAERSVPGFFAADGDAAESGATAGDRWRVHFTPDVAGNWYWVASFRGGIQVALDPGPTAGQPESFDGVSGAFSVQVADPGAPGFLSKGRLEYVGKHHLRFAETHEYYLKNGAGSPENFLGYFEFDGTSDLGGAVNDLNTSGALDGLHHFDPHLGDYVDLGVPLWNGKGRRIFGALSYLASRGVNSLYALTYNADGGDGQEVWPWSTYFDKLHFDVSKLAQWERVLDHMTRAGIVWHVMTQESENQFRLDGGTLGVQRKLYYRELVARFAHAPGLVWNLGEENANLPNERIAFADFLRALDPYDHPIAMHNVPGNLAGTYGALLGTHLELATLQSDLFGIPFDVQQLVNDSLAAGRPWIVDFSEQNPANHGAVPDAADFWHDSLRQDGLWPTVLGQGGGCEWYFGYAHPHSDLDCEDFRSRDNLWGLTERALDFLREHVRFEEMQHADGLAFAGGPSVLAKRGEFYLVYLPLGGPASLDLEGHAGPFLVSWFDARNGGGLQSTAIAQVSGPGVRSLGSPPGAGDWVAFVRKATNLAPVIESLTIAPDPFDAGRDFSVQVHARDPNGPSDDLHVSGVLTDPSGATTPVSLPHRGGTLYSFFLPAAGLPAPGMWHVLVTVRDSGGLEVTRSASFVAF